VSLAQPLRRILQRLGQSDEERLNEELQAFCKAIPGSLRIAEAPLRQRVRIAGMVRRITVRPVGGFETLGVVLSDGTGEVHVRWMGRRSIDGLVLGSRLLVDGVLGREQDRLVMVNPTFEFV
jgi:cytochrome c-type biogenesis protein CcmE